MRKEWRIGILPLATSNASTDLDTDATKRDTDTVPQEDAQNAKPAHAQAPTSSITGNKEAKQDDNDPHDAISKTCLGNSTEPPSGFFAK